MIHTNEWKPDTCKCSIQYTWDDSVPVDQRVHTPTQILKECPEHSGLGDVTPFYNAILSENTRKNLTVNHLITFDELAREVLKDGNPVREFISKINWFFTGSDDNRILNIDLSSTSLTTQKKTQIQKFADNLFGDGKVLIIG